MKVTSLYDLPLGWAVATIDDLIGAEGLFVDGDWIESKDQNPNGNIRLIQLADIGDGVFKDKSNRFMSYERAIDINCTFLEHGDILVARMPDPLGRAIVFPCKEENTYVTVVDIAIIRTGQNVLNKWLMYFINSPEIRKKINSFQTGTTRKRISRRNLAQIKIPVPPVNEQFQIVQKIEELFSEIDHVETNLTDIKIRLDFYWQTILDSAFCGNISGEYQAKIKNRNKYKSLNALYEIPFEWEWSELGIHTDFVGAGSTPKGGRSIYVNNGVPFIRSQNVLNYSLNLDDIAYITDAINEKMSRTKTQINDVLLNITGASIGRCAYIPENFAQANVNQHVCIVRTNPSLFYKYLSLYLNSPTIQRLIQEWSSGATREALTLSQIRGIPIPICSIEEQKFIVAELESQHTIIAHIRSTIEMKIAQIQILKQSVLNKAFEGRLVSQNPRDESASELLKKINAERIEYAKNKPKEKKVKIKIEKMERTKSVFDLLKEAQKPVSAKEVWQQSKHCDSIDDFYAELKSISDLIEQTKSKTEILLSLKK